MRGLFQTIGSCAALLGLLSPIAQAGDVVCSDAKPSCLEDEFCLYPDDTCDAPDREGVCRERPDGCGLSRDPVCGCDGVSYGNPCRAHVAGVSVAYYGDCGRRACRSDLPCPAGDFCKYADDSCFLPRDGLCTALPESCAPEEAAVCGCDGVTYPNACLADAAGASIRLAAPCDEVCDGTDEQDCVAGEFCLHAMQTGCQPTASSGRCVQVPDDCSGPCQPVCACDGQSYGSVCEAVAAGVQPIRQSECDEVRFVAFDSPMELRWNTVLGVSGYHVYRLVRNAADPPPSHAGACLGVVDSGNGMEISDGPEPGKAWWLQVAYTDENLEGSLGLASDCTRRQPQASCPGAGQ